MSAVVPPRADVAREETWDLEAMFPSDAAWDAAFQAADASLATMAPYAGTLGSSAGQLLAALQAKDAIEKRLSPVLVYAFLRQSEDATNAHYAGLADRARGLAARAGAALSFLAPEIAAIPASTMDGWYAAEPDLASYRHAIGRIHRLKDHVRSPEVERTIAEAGAVFSGFETIHDMLESGELPLGDIHDERNSRVTLALGTIGKYYHSADRRVRREAWEQSGDAYLRYQNTFAAALAGAVKRDVFLAQQHGFSSSLEAALSQDNIPTAVFHNLVNTVWEHFPLWHRYFRARRKLLGLPKGELHGWDLEAPLSAGGPKVSWDDGVGIILDSLAPLGRSYVEDVAYGMSHRWVDRCANIGKHGGAFSYGTFGSMPYISMTWEDNLSSISTLTHEIGHSMHSKLTWEHQPITYADYGMSAAETASNFNQSLLGKHLLALNEDRDWTLTVIEERMENHQRYLFIMPILARFELACHERVEQGESIGADWMNETLLSYYREGYGSEVEIDPERMAIVWARFPHLYANFYVFQYGIGISAAAALAGAIANGDTAARDRYLDFLKSGGSKDQIAALKDAGIDMTTPEPIRAAFKLLEGYVAKLEELAR